MDKTVLLPSVYKQTFINMLPIIQFRAYYHNNETISNRFKELLAMETNLDNFTVWIQKQNQLPLIPNTYLIIIIYNGMKEIYIHTENINLPKITITDLYNRSL